MAIIDEIKELLIDNIDLISSNIEDAILNDEDGLDNIQYHCGRILREAFDSLSESKG